LVVGAGGGGLVERMGEMRVEGGGGGGGEEDCWEEVGERGRSRARD